MFGVLLRGLRLLLRTQLRRLRAVQPAALLPAVRRLQLLLAPLGQRGLLLRLPELLRLPRTPAPETIIDHFLRRYGGRRAARVGNARPPALWADRAVHKHKPELSRKNGAAAQFHLSFRQILLTEQEEELGGD